MLKFAMAGKLEYFQKGYKVLENAGYTPELEIHGTRVIKHKPEIQEKRLELLICLAHPFILTKEEIDLFPKGCINLHSGIPHYCGRSPVNWMIIDGVKEIPVAVHYMSEQVDGGDIIVEDIVTNERDDDYNSVLGKITDQGSKLLLAAVRQIDFGTVYRKRQVVPRRYPKRRTPEDSQVDWNKTSFEMHNFISALVSPMPNAFAFTQNGKRVEFQRAYRGKKVGEVIDKTNDGKYVITTADGVILAETNCDLRLGERFKI